MSQSNKNPLARPKIKPRGFQSWAKRKLLNYWQRQKKCLLVTAVILFAFVFLEYAPWLNARRQQLSLENNASAEVLISDSTLAVLDDGILGGPINLGEALVSPAQASVDFSADDAAENQDFIVMQESSLVASNNPDNDTFSGLRREVLTYIVQGGDSAFSIALKFGINTDTVLWANNLTESSIIKPGQSVLILPINGVQIKVGAKDTLAAIAKKYSGKAEEIITFNHLPADGSLMAGQSILVPNGEIPAAAKPKVTAPKYATGTQSVGWMIAPTSGRNWGRLHGNGGVDIANVCGTPIYAAAAGTVTLVDGVGWNWGYGKYLQIKHPNGVTTLYAHTSRIVVEPGENVGQGQLIALMGTTGRSTGCHLHFEVHGAKNPMRR